MITPGTRWFDPNSSRLFEIVRILEDARVVLLDLATGEIFPSSYPPLPLSGYVSLDVTETFTRTTWYDAEFSPWQGCLPASPACVACAARTGRRRLSASERWAQPRRWEDAAVARGAPVVVRCAPDADVMDDFYGVAPLDRPVLEVERARLWEVIEGTPHVAWVLTTRRADCLISPTRWRGRWPENVWLCAVCSYPEELEPQLRGLAAADARRAVWLDHDFSADLCGYGLSWAICAGPRAAASAHAAGIVPWSRHGDVVVPDSLHLGLQDWP